MRAALSKLVAAAAALVLLLLFHTNAMAGSSGRLAIVSMRASSHGTGDKHSSDAQSDASQGDGGLLPGKQAQGHPKSSSDTAAQHGSTQMSELRRRLAAAASAAQRKMSSKEDGEGKPQSLSPSPPHTATAAGGVTNEHSELDAPGTADHSTSAHADCPAGRRPYHVVMTAASGKYQEWQSRIAYYHYQKQKRLDPCSDLGSFTRLFNSPQKAPDTLMEEMPTLLVSQLDHGRCKECDHGFIVMNRPWGVVQLVESEYWRERIGEAYVLVIETDHMLMRPPKNEATPERPVGFGFYYMTGTDPKLQPVVQKFLAPGISPTTVDAVGPSPLIIHKPMLERLARPWWDMSLKMKGDSDANAVFGWVLEMWGYNIAARNMGIRHTVSQDIQVEPQGIGTDDMEGKCIYHYTFGLVIGGWRLDKRGYFGRYPSDHIPDPPMCSARSGFIMARLFSEAAQNIAGWENRERSSLPVSEATDSPLARLVQLKPEQAGTLGELLRGTGPWRFGSVDGLFLFSRGIAYLAKQDSAGAHGALSKGVVGSWSAARGDTGSLQLCGARYTLRFSDPSAPWAFSATLEGATSTSVVRGQLPHEAQQRKEMLPHSHQLRLAHLGSGVIGVGAAADGVVDSAAAVAAAENATLAEQLAGSGPWLWAGTGPLGFMRGGHLVTPWGSGRWGVTRGAGAESAADDAVFADFANSEHTVRLLDLNCLRLTSTRKADGEKVGLDFMGLEDASSCASDLHKLLV